jgi:hypothetical protein
MAKCHPGRCAVCSALLPAETPHAFWSLRLYAFWPLRQYSFWPLRLYAFWPLLLYVEQNLHIHRGIGARVTVHMDICTNYKHAHLRQSRSMEAPLYICTNYSNVKPEEIGLNSRSECPKSQSLGSAPVVVAGCQNTRLRCRSVRRFPVATNPASVAYCKP